MKVALDTVALAIRALQERLGLTQEAMARRLGCTLGGYGKWIRGQRIPQGQWMLKLLALCDDEETRELFRAAGGEVAPRGQASPLAPKARAKFRYDIDRTGTEKGGHLPPRNEQEEELLRLYSDAATGINLLYEAAAAGSKGARTVLADLADKLTTRGGDWRRMKYLKK
jgi:transcriptional regulator with XRE-family HTH domain